MISICIHSDRIRRAAPVILAATLLGGVLMISPAQAQSNNRRSRSDRNTQAAAATQRSASTQNAQSVPEYEPLQRKSIFSRTPTHTGRPGGGEPTTAPAARPSVPIFIGVLLDEQQVLAVIEDSANGIMMKFQEGDVLPGTAGVLKSITLDQIEIAAPDQSVKKIHIGQTLTGEAPPEVVMTPPPDSGASAGPGGSTPAASGEGSADVAEKMRRRRQQQMGK